MSQKITTIYFPIGVGPDGMQPAYHIVHLQDIEENREITLNPPKGTFKTTQKKRRNHKKINKSKRESNRTAAMFK